MKSLRSAASLVAILVITAVSCEDEPVPEEETPPSKAIYGDPLSTQLIPFPSDRYTVPDPSTATGLRVTVSAQTTGDLFVSGYPLIEQRLGEMDGFSTAGGIAIGFDRPIDGTPFAGKQGKTPIDALDPAFFTSAESPIVLIDVDPDSPEQGKLFGLLPRYFEQAKDDYFPIDEFTVVARPTEPLEPGRRYLFAATSRVLSADGRPVLRSDETAALIEDAPADAYAQAVQDGLAVLEESAGISRDDVIVVSTFTTASMRDVMIALGSRARQQPAPAVVNQFEIETQPTPPDDRVRFRATFETPEYRRKDGDWTFELGDDGAPIVQQTIPIELFLAFSESSVSGPRPVVIYQHGLGGDKDGSWGTAGRLTELGVAVVAIDSPEHGSRGSGGEVGLVQSVLAYFGIDDATGEFDIARARDNFRQMASDQLELVRLIGSLGELDLLPPGAPDGIPDLDVSRIMYIGHSFGSVQGPTIFALAPEIESAVWNVGGDNLMLLLEDSGLFSVMVNALRPPGTSDGALARFMAATQGIVDPGDPVNYARFALRESLPGVAPAAGPRNILLQETVGDNIVPNSSSDAVARATGLQLVNPIAPPFGLSTITAPAKGSGPNGSTAVLYQYQFMNGGETATHGELIFATEAQTQYVEFFRSALSDGAATVIAP